MVLTWRGGGSYRAIVETVEPPRRLAFRWLLRDGVEPEPGHSTLVVMTLTPTAAGTTLHVVESGFSDLAWPDPERDDYRKQNDNGWDVELGQLTAYVATVTGASRTR